MWVLHGVKALGDHDVGPMKMRLSRRHTAMLGAIGLHIALLSWTVASPEPAPEPELELTVVEIVNFVDNPDAELALEGALAARSAEPAAEPVLEPEAAPEPEEIEEPRPKEPPTEPEPRTRPEPDPDAAVQPDPSPDPSPEPDADPGAASEPKAAAQPPEPPDEPAAGKHDEGTPEPTPGSGTGRAGEGMADGHADGQGATNFQSYGAEIIRIVNAEIDADPVAGISRRDTIEFELMVLPNGRLKRTGSGRFDVANVVRSSIGPVRTRALMRRIQRASSRFPKHPKGFERRVYVVGVTLRFTRNRA